MAFPTGTQLYTTPPAGLTNVNLNALGSDYASLFSHDTTDLIRRSVRPLIFDAAPKMFYDLTILDTMPKQKVAEEFYFAEKVYGRMPVVASNSPGSVTYPSTSTITCADTTMVTVDSLVINPNDLSIGTVVTITANTSIVVSPQVGASFGAITATDVIPVIGTIEADGATDIKRYFRMSVVERYNFVQMYVNAMRFTPMELDKYMNQGTFDNYLSMNHQEWLNQIRLDISNMYWMGIRGEVVLSDGTKAKTSGGIYPTMVAAGCLQTSATMSTLHTALASTALATNYKNYGDVRFAYMAPEIQLALSELYKTDKTRYKPNDKMADLMLDEVNLGQSRIVFVPMQRFNDTASFPASFQNKIIIVDQASITPCYTLAEDYGKTLGRVNNGTLNTGITEWASMTFSQMYHNPLGGGIINIT